MKKILIKLSIIIIMIIWIISFSFAEGGTSTWAEAPSILWLISNLLNILWLPFAIIAGKLFTNDLVYWSFFSIDTMLFHIFQYSRTLANFIIWFVFVFWILWFFAWKVKNIFGLLWKIIVSSILVNMSWFILWALIDISTILIAVVWSLPMHMIWTSDTVPIEKIKYCSTLEINPSWVSKVSDAVKNLVICKKWSEKKMEASSFFSSMNDMTWPLIFIWTSILNIDKNREINSEQVSNNKSINKSSRIRNVLHIMIVLLFVIPIILLIIIWVIRIFWLWIYISFTPLLVLDYIFWSKYISSSNDNFKLSNVIWLIFQPVLIVLAMWISIIFLATIQTAFIWWTDDSQAKKDLWICNGKSLCLWDKTVVTMEWNLTQNFMEDAWWVFGYIVLSFLSIFLMWWLIKLAFQSTKISSAIANSTFSFVEESLKSVPIIPTSAWWVWVAAIQRTLWKRLLSKSFDIKATERANNLISKIDSAFNVGWNSIWLNTKTVWAKEIEESRNKFQTYHSYWNFIETIKKDTKNQKIIPGTDIYFKQVTKIFIDKLLRVDKQATEQWLMNLWFDKKKLWNLSMEELFANSNFRIFISSIIKKPEILSWATTNIQTISNDAKKINQTDLLYEEL